MITGRRIQRIATTTIIINPVLKIVIHFGDRLEN